jgi:hypothetical protein
MDTKDMVGVKEAAELLSVNRTTIDGWHSRRVTTKFPETRLIISRMPIWDALEIAFWWTYYQPKRKIPKVGYLSKGWQDIVAQYPGPDGELPYNWQEQLRKLRKVEN